MPCVDQDDFQSDAAGNGRLQLKPTTYQNALEDFSFQIPLVTPDGSYIPVAPFDPVTVAIAGRYLVSWDISGYVGIFQNNPNTPLQGATFGALSINGAFQQGTETKIVALDNGGQQLMSSMSIESTGSGSRIFQLAAGAQLGLMAGQSGNGTNVSIIQSNAEGRCRITAERIGA